MSNNLNTRHLDRKTQKTYATEANLVKGTKKLDENLLGEDNDMGNILKIVVKTPEDRWTAIYRLDENTRFWATTIAELGFLVV